MKTKKRIAFFQDRFSVGGIQKSLLNLLCCMDYTKYDVDLYLFDKTEFWQQDLPAELHIKYLPPLGRLYSFLPFSFAYRAVRPVPHTEPYDVAIDFNSYQMCCAAWAAKIPARYRVSWIHNDVEIKLKNEWKYRVLWNAFRGKFSHFDEFVGVSESLIEPFRRMSGVRDSRFCAIPNYIDVDDISRKMLLEPEDFHPDPNCVNFVAVGHLNHQKAYDIMVELFAKACQERPDLHLYIIGDGPERQNLQEQIARLSMTQNITLLGYQTNPYAYLYRADAFLSTSRYEGQPLNLMEAMVIGLPIYCTKNLEKYCAYVTGSDDLVSDLVSAQKQPKQPQSLSEYNKGIHDAFDALVARADLPRQ